MRCLYCGKELALLKRLTGGGEFCSDAHKQRYQEEYDRIALSRLLQAQKKGQKSAPEPKEPFALPAAPPAPAVAEEHLKKAVAEQPPAPEIEIPEAEIAETETAVSEIPANEFPFDAVLEAGFLAHAPSVAEMPELAPDSKFSPELAAPAPVIPERGLEKKVPEFSTAGPSQFTVTVQNSQPEIAGPEANFIGQFSPASVTRPSLPVPGPIQFSQSGLVARGQSIAIKIPLTASKAAPDKIQALNFQLAVQFRESALLALPTGSIEFPDQESDGIARGLGNDGSVLEPLAAEVVWSHPAVAAASDSPEEDAREEEATEAAAVERLNPEPPASEPPATPHATLEALSRLHEVMQQETVPPRPSRESAEAAMGSSSVGVLVEERAEVQAAEVHEAVTGGFNDLLEIPIKVFALPKRAPVSVNVLSTAVPALVPRLKGLPLRPKVGLAPSGSVPQAKAIESTAPAPPAKPKPAASVQTSAPSAPKPPTAASKSKTPETKPAPAFKPAQPAKSTEKPAPPAKPAEAASKRVESLPLENAAESAKRSAAKESGQRKQPREPESGPTKQPAAEPVPSPKPAPALISEEALPSFGSLGRSTSFWGSFKVKFGAVILLVAGCAAYFALSGKPQRAPAPVTKSSAESAGPSIMLGEGGWVVGWGRDAAAGQNLNREITIYRPSLKLSDYRIEFQGDIENKSLGWVFRAADPDNYYAMKLTAVSTTPPAKVALFKYIVVKGRPTQVGRVPVDLEVNNDTVFKVRVDVRGPKFSTYVQSQPVDVWTDDQLKSGGVGFLNEHGERGRIKSVSIRYLSSEDK